MPQQFGSNIYYYNQNIKNLLIGFLNLFDGFRIRRWDSLTNEIEQEINVPILYGAIDRGSYMNQEDTLSQRYVELPLIHFDLTGMEIDRERLTSNLHLLGVNNNEMVDNLVPIPYKFSIQMNIFAKYQEDIYQLIEQIVPLFNYFRIFYIKHPIFPELTLSNWTKIESYPSFSFNSEYSAEDRRGVLAVPIGFSIEGYMVRESYKSGGLIKHIITNYNDYLYSSKTLERFNIIGDLTIKKLIINKTNPNTIKVDDVITNNTINAIVLEIIDNDTIIVKTNKENDYFMKDDKIYIGANEMGKVVQNYPYKGQELVETIETP